MNACGGPAQPARVRGTSKARVRALRSGGCRCTCGDTHPLLDLGRLCMIDCRSGAMVWCRRESSSA